MFVAAMTPNQDLRTYLFSKAYNYANDLNLPSEFLPICILRVPINITASPSSAAWAQCTHH